jgi:hypothetical protein
MKHLIRTLLTITLIGAIIQNAEAYLPLLDNQPLATLACPLNRPVSTESSSGRIGYINVKCVVDNIDVVYTVTVPPDCVHGGCGLILDNHGATMNAAQQNAGTKLRQYGWTATQYGAPTPFIVVQPNLTDLFDRYEIVDFDSVVGGLGPYYNEVPNIVHFINHLIDLYQVDTDRTHMYGFSLGGSTVNAFYCDMGLSHMFASYAIGGQKFRCPLDKPVLLMVGDGDINNRDSIESAEATIKAMGGVVSKPVVNDPGYAKPEWEWDWLLGFQRKGRHHHMRHQVGDIVFETIRHSGSTLPLLGHCHPANKYNSWLVCYANFETGRKVIDFFIQNPRR